MNKKVEHIGNQYTSQENKKKQRQKMKMRVEIERASRGKEYKSRW